MDLHFNLRFNAVQEYSQTVGGRYFPVRFSEQAIENCARNTKSSREGLKEEQHFLRE